MDEKELVLLTKQGDVKAFCTLYDKYKRKLYSYAYFKLNNQQDAEDAVQDCALTAFEEISKLNDFLSVSAITVKDHLEKVQTTKHHQNQLYELPVDLIDENTYRFEI